MKLLVFNEDPQTKSFETADKKFKGVYIKGKHARVEIKATFGANIKITVYKNSYNPAWPVYEDFGSMNDKKEFEAYKLAQANFYQRHEDLVISTNNKIDLKMSDLDQINTVIQEAKEYLNK